LTPKQALVKTLNHSHSRHMRGENDCFASVIFKQSKVWKSFSSWGFPQTAFERMTGAPDFIF
jgi:hypothetical protein